MSKYTPKHEHERAAVLAALRAVQKHDPQYALPHLGTRAPLATLYELLEAAEWLRKIADVLESDGHGDDYFELAE